MSIQRVQTQRVLSSVAHELYSSGKAPTLSEIIARIQRYFSSNPAGQPLKMPEVAQVGRRSDPDSYNEMLDTTAKNMDILYEVLLNHVQDVVELNNALHSSIESLNKRRRKLERRLDDYLLGLRNADGYFYSVSDDFSDLDQLQIPVTSAEIDTDSGSVLIPSNTERKKRVPANTYSRPNINITTEEGVSSFRELADLQGAVDDGSNNTVWAFEVIVSEPQEVIATVDVSLRDDNGDAPFVSSVQLLPYGMSPVQVTVSTANDEESMRNFGSEIKTDTGKMLFDDSVHRMGTLRLRLRKTEYDYSDFRNGQNEYHYIFGAERLTLIQQSYERSATLISTPYSIPSDLQEDMVIDAVSLVVDDEQPADTSIKYYVAATDQESIEDLSKLVWHRLRPIGSARQENQLVRFEGTTRRTRSIVEDPDHGELQEISLQDTGPVAERNPSPSIIPGTEIYRLAEFEESFIPSGTSLLEGRNATRIYSTHLEEEAIEGLVFWKERFDNDGLDLNFGRIDTGDGFFYGGDVGVGGRSVYVETYLNSPTRRETVLAEMQKVDERSRAWEVRVFLNGNQIAHMPMGEHRKQVPWAFMKGPNHIAVLVQIPDEDEVPEAYTGVLNLMAGQDLFTYGDVYLSKWEYVDLFDMKYNESETNPPKTFTVHEGEIISRRQLSAHSDLRYTAPTGSQPSSVVFRADLSRARNNPRITPKLSNYRLRFSYAHESSLL